MWTFLVVSALRPCFPSTQLLPGLAPQVATPAVRELLRRANWTLRAGTLGSALAFHLLPILTIGWPLPALLLPKTALDRHAHAMATHRIYLIRMAMTMLKTVGGLIWGAEPQVRAILHMPAYPADPGTHRDDQFTAVRPGQTPAVGDNPQT